MKTHVVKTTPLATLSEAVDLMDIYQVDSLPVVDAEGQLCGMVAEQDISRVYLDFCLAPSRANPLDAASELQQGFYRAAALPVQQIMCQTVFSVSEETDIVDTARVFFVNDLTRIPVTNLEGNVIGTLNRIDIIQAIFERTLPE